MTKASELLALADRCGAATAEQQRELLEQAFYAIHSSPLDADRLTAEQTRVWAAREGRFFSILRAEAYESAAMTLVPEGSPFVLTNADLDSVRGDYSKWRCSLVDGDPNLPPPCASQALAITAAALRSIASKESEDG